jgi:hypothetical protein
MKWSWDTIEDMSDQIFHLDTLAGEFGGGVDIINDG